LLFFKILLLFLLPSTRQFRAISFHSLWSDLSRNPCPRQNRLTAQDWTSTAARSAPSDGPWSHLNRFRFVNQQSTNVPFHSLSQGQTRSSGKNYSPTFLDTTRPTLKTTRLTILLLPMYSLPR
jgi:hypothetical protein